MKVIKRNAVILTVLLFVGVAVYLNWSYSKKEEAAGKEEDKQLSAEQTVLDESEAEDADESLNAAGEAGLVYTDPEEDDSQTVSAEITEQLSLLRLRRQQARDEAQATLQLIADSGSADSEVEAQAVQQLLEISQWTQQEAQLESLLISKGYPDCVVYMTKEGITVSVPVGETALTTAAVARITDLVLAETEYTAAMLTIVEIK